MRTFGPLNYSTASRSVSGGALMARGRTTHYQHKPMKTHIKLAIALVAVAALVQTARSGDDSEQSEFPQITAQPTDQAALVGNPVTLSVQATNGDLTYQWQRNGATLEGQTNSVLALENVSVGDAGLYTCDVTQSGGETVPTRAASLSVAADDYYGGDQIVVFGLPKVSNGAIGDCPGYFAGYINYTKTIAQGWGWIPLTNSTTVFTAADGGGRTNTKVMYLGKFGDSGCGQTMVTVPYPPPSPSYRFTIYFPNNVPSTNYPIVLTGFNP